MKKLFTIDDFAVVSDGKFRCGTIEDRLTDIEGLLD